MDLKAESLKLHRENNGKLGVVSKVPLNSPYDLSIAYTPGVAQPCLAIKEENNLSFELTCRGNMVAVVTDGTRVLGLGDIGPQAAMPVMEGKAVLFKRFGDVDAIPICLDTKDPKKIIEIVKLLEPTFAGINLEDISSPKCYDIEDELKEIMDIPVFHDDQHGTAVAVLAGLINALKLTSRQIESAKIVVNGCGAAGSAIGRLLVKAGAKNIFMVDLNGVLYKGMVNLNRIQQYLSESTNHQMIKGDLYTVVKGADVLIGVSKPGAFDEKVIRSMNRDPIVFALSNPDPEISYHQAISFGARIAATGRSDTPNQVNNVLVFPGIFRGAIDVRARKITDEMKINAAYAISGLVTEAELDFNYIIPSAYNPNVAPNVAAAVSRTAVDQGLARKTIDIEKRRNELIQKFNISTKK
ncbi:MAG TPA: NADP-dependent malic enzyme [Petrotogaceae bacterium]|nr:NADP-dependent malic enzyme [Petrotogaceae bacterium]